MSHPAFPIIAACLLLASCSPSTPTEVRTLTLQDTLAQEPMDPENTLLPARYKHAWELPDLSRWDAYWREQYTESTGDLRHRTGDLDGDGALDHALLLSRKDTTRRDSAYALVVQFGNQRDTLLEVAPWMGSEGGIGVGITLEPPGELGHLGGEEGGESEGSVQVVQPAVTLEYFERASVTWYWEKGAFHKVWTGD